MGGGGREAGEDERPWERDCRLPCPCYTTGTQPAAGGGGVNVLCNRLLTSRSSVVSLTAVMHAVLTSLLDATQSRTCILAIQSQGIIVIKYKNMLGQNLQSN